MSLITDILGAVLRNPGGTVSELADTLETAEKRVRDNLIHARNRELVTMRKDDVTNLPGYTLTTAGKEFLAKSTTEVETPEPEYDPDSVSFDTNKRADANQRRAEDAEKDAMTLLGIIADIRKAIGDPEGKIMLGDLAKHISEIYKLGEAHKLACMSWEKSMMQAVGEDGVSSVVAAIEKIKNEATRTAEFHAELDRHRAATTNLASELATERQARMALQEQMNADPGIDVKDAAVGYLVKAPKRKPRLLTKPESAVSAAMAAARNGSGRGEVFALVPVGRAVRGAEWRDAE